MFHDFRTQLMQNCLPKSCQRAALRHGKSSAEKNNQEIADPKPGNRIDAFLRQAACQKIIDNNFHQIRLNQYAQIGNQNAEKNEI